MSDRPISLFQKVWDAHRVRELASGQTQLLIGTHLIHEVTSPQAFAMLCELGLPVRFPGRTFATVDHIIPTDDQSLSVMRSTSFSSALMVGREWMSMGKTCRTTPSLSMR